MSLKKAPHNPTVQDLRNLAAHVGAGKIPLELECDLIEFLTHLANDGIDNEPWRERTLHGVRQAERMKEVYRDVIKTFWPTVQPRIQPRGWIWYGVLGRLEDYLKWSTADFLARTLRQDELPPQPSWCPPGLPFTGNAASLLKRACLYHQKRSSSDKAVAIAYSLYQAKGGSLPVTKETVEAKVEKAVMSLTTEHERNCDEVQDVLEDQVKRTVREVFLPFKTRQERVTPGGHRIPSLRSSFQNGRKDWGAFGYILRDSFYAHTLSFPTLIGVLVTPRGVGWLFSPMNPDDYDWLIEQSLRAALLKDECACYPVGLTEPFKVRVITRGDADMYHLARRWQKTVHGILRQHPTFRLIGGPIDFEALDYIAKRSKVDGRSWVSADYTAATDNLNPQLSLVALEEICQILNIPLEEQIVLRKALSNHMMYLDEHDEDPRAQRWGQLMGSPVSFPILCLVNAAVTRFSLEVSNWCVGTQLLTDLPMLFNGDDAGFRANPSEYLIWKGITRSAGLEFSVGKNFFSPDTLVINSQVHKCEIRADYFGQQYWRLRVEPTLATSLLYGQVRVQTTNANDKTHLVTSNLSVGRNLGQMCQDLVRDWTGETRDWLVGRFIELNRSTLKCCASGQSWYLPRTLGGLGVPEWSGSEVRPAQLKLAAYLATRSLGDPALRDYLYPDMPDFLRDYLYPDMPDFLRTYIGDRCKAMREAGVPDGEMSLRGGLPGLALWSCLGAAGGDQGELYKKSLRSWESLKKKALATKLKPMCLTTVRNYIRERRDERIWSWEIEW
ncbi:RNA-dependent RNA polymerase [Hubei narna-like virus 2]|uniref:RNA-dependent RNA polymerase n=1 Tax=Hubei narna-like virus 2 TaxID=1922950 RepID=UPI00090CCD22|nr:RNA-dependent RNA polymerase [Hubei narna-like virus 2]APG77205.1 RNA-dependent RNA polymerase [Hubei narna-like virus 2]